MGISSVVRRWLWRVGIGAPPQDTLLDWWITDALTDEAQVPVPPGAWNRLRMAIAERKLVDGYGMWVLDQTPHDPPDSIPSTLSDAQLARALHVHNFCQAQRRGWAVGHPSLGGICPTFIAAFIF